MLSTRVYYESAIGILSDADNRLSAKCSEHYFLLALFFRIECDDLVIACSCQDDRHVETKVYNIIKNDHYLSMLLSNPAC